VEAVLEGRQPIGLGLPQLLGPFPMEWVVQREALSERRTGRQGIVGPA
jgi:hypothetical protein